MSVPFPWQQTLWNNLVIAYEQDRLPSAILLSGVEGLGQSELAHAFAEYVLTENNAAGKSAALFASGNHPDFIHIKPEADSRTIKIDQVRQLQVRLRDKSHAGAYRIAIIEPAETLNIAASNALLKLVEEPGDKILLFFISHHPKRLAATLRSRCQKITIRVEDTATVLEWLRTRLSTSQQNAKQLLELAEGAPLKALQLSEPAQQDLYAELLQDLVLLLDAKQTAMQLAEKYARHEFNIFLTINLHLLHQMICLYHNAVSVKPAWTELLQKWQTQLKPLKVFMLLDKIYALRRAIALVPSLNQQLLLEDLFIGVSQYRE